MAKATDNGNENNKKWNGQVHKNGRNKKKEERKRFFFFVISKWKLTRGWLFFFYSKKKNSFFRIVKYSINVQIINIQFYFYVLGSMFPIFLLYLFLTRSNNCWCFFVISSSFPVLLLKCCIVISIPDYFFLPCTALVVFFYLLSWTSK